MIMQGSWTLGKDMKPYKNKKYLSSVYYCPCCRNQAYWDTDYGQQLFDYCPYCGKKLKQPEENKA